MTPPAADADHERLAPLARAVRLDGVIALDGRLDEAVWARAPVADAFFQREPDEGVPATQRTEVRFAYDDETLYIGARMFDDQGAEGVVSRLVRRDNWPDSDQLTIIFDTFLDHLGRTVLSINPAGVRGDAFGPGGSHADDSWDPVWRARANVDSLGWTAEFEIPFAQLRFPQGRDQRWGLQIERFVHRLNESQMWSFWWKNESGGPSRYGHLDGIEAPAVGTNKLELLPYVTSSAEFRGGEVDASNPFDDDSEQAFRAGVDLKYLLTSNLTLNATANPDFGQAEVDPAVVNLSAFETFFPEKREFFIAGRGLFSFGGFSCMFCSNASSLGMLFTRRIGRAPQGGGFAHDAGEFADVPDNTTILSAAKVTGRTAGGLSIGLLNAVTSSESADVVGTDGEFFEKQVEPFSNYFAGRVKKDMKDGDLQIGGIVTSVVRDLDDPDLKTILNSHSEGLGLDGQLWWGDRTYRLMASAAVTNISGSPDAILLRQESSARYFQRPDRQHGGNGLFSDRFDPTLTSMRGFGSYTRVAKDAGDWRWESALNIRSPGFENNDLAFLTRTDFVWMNGNVARQFTTPTKYYRRLDFTVGAQQQYNFDGDLTDRQYHAWAGTQTPFWWWLSGFYLTRPSVLDDRLTRGGPVLRRAGVDFMSFNMNTDSRKPFWLSTNLSHGRNDEGARDYNFSVGLNLKPVSNVVVSLRPSFNTGESTAQYVTAVDDAAATDFFGTRYVFADLKQRSFSMNTRLNVTFTPTMSLELFMQPLFSSNDFSRFKEFDAPRGLSKSVFGEDIGTVQAVDLGDDGRQFLIDPDGSGPAAEFTVDDPDFNFRSLRGNAVFRWEYTPGSTLFFVWTQDRSSFAEVGDFDFARDRTALFDADSDNIFLIKVNYWLGM
ncbi:MAG: DUF5916 domain-containing protein [Gemmatimonadota bacterium]